MKKITYQTRRVGSCFNRVIELNEKMLILIRFINSEGKTDPLSHERGISSKVKKITYQTRHVRSCFNRVIELNQKMLILKKIVTKSVFLCDDDN
jgi:hypothetical protein